LKSSTEKFLKDKGLGTFELPK
jgi:hypothetical protein